MVKARVAKEKVWVVRDDEDYILGVFASRGGAVGEIDRRVAAQEGPARAHWVKHAPMSGERQEEFVKEWQGRLREGLYLEEHVVQGVRVSSPESIEEFPDPDYW